MSSELFGRLAVTASFVVALAMPLISGAQEEENQGPALLQVRTVSLNADGVQTWEGLQTQLAEANRAAEAAPRDVWEEIRGDLDTYHIVDFPENMAGFDEQQGEPTLGDGMGEWVASIVPTVRERSQTIMRHHANLSIPSAEDYEPNLLVLGYTRIKQGKVGAYHDWIENKLKPAMEAAGISGVYYSHIAHGGTANTCVSAIHVENWAALDQRFLPDLTGEERGALFGDLANLVVASERRILRYRADMSN
jgi:hypothetical protein